MITLRQLRELYTQATKDGKKFVDKHKVVKTPDANKNGDDVFNASNVKGVKRQPDHGYDPGNDAKVYEEKESNLDEGDVIHFPGKMKAEKEKPDTAPGWMLRKSPELAQKLKDAQDRVKKRKEIKEASKAPKNPDHIKRVEGSSTRGEVIVTTNAGAKHTISAKDTGGKMPKPGEHISKYVKEEVDLDEVLKPSMGADAYIKDFVHSKNPKFAGKSKKERINQALGAFYAAKRGE